MKTYHVTYARIERHLITVAVEAESAKEATAIIVNHDDKGSLPVIRTDVDVDEDFPNILGVVEAPKK